MPDIYITGETINNICDVSIYKRSYVDSYPIIKYYCKNILYIDENNDMNIITSSTTFFIKMDWINYFIDNIMPFIKKPFILVTHNSDYMSGEHNLVTHNSDYMSGTHNIILQNNLLIKWYGQNMNIITDKTECLPIGLENIMWNRTNFKTIDTCKSNKKTKLLYLNFNLSTNKNRGHIMNTLSHFKRNNNKKWDEYMKELSEYKFSISPEGTGIDCHRTWECLYLGVIPIVIKSNCMSYFKELPILFVDNYDCINEQYLLEQYTHFQNKQFNLEKVDINYWKKTIYHLSGLK